MTISITQLYSMFSLPQMLYTSSSKWVYDDCCVCYDQTHLIDNLFENCHNYMTMYLVGAKIRLKLVPAMPHPLVDIGC